MAIQAAICLPVTMPPAATIVNNTNNYVTAKKTQTISERIERELRTQSPPVSTTVNAPRAAAVSNFGNPLPRPASQESAPNIAVESTQDQNDNNHTVTVTIGRIEVRPPKSEAPKPQQPAAPKAASRIMTLDDYVRRRSGGAG